MRAPWTDAQFKPLTVSVQVFSTTPSVFRYGDVVRAVTFSPVRNRAWKVLRRSTSCGTAVHDGGQRTESDRRD